MTPEQQAILDRLQRVLDPQTFEMIKAILLGLWSGAFAAAGYGEWVIKLLLEWAAKQGTWMWLELKGATSLAAGAAETAAEAAPAAAAGGTASVLALGALAPLLLLLGGLLLPASKMGDIGFDWGGWFRDPCEDMYKDLLEDYLRLTRDRAAFLTAPSRPSTMALLTAASSLINDCDKLVRKCPGTKNAAMIRTIRAAAERARDECLDWLATH